MLILGGIFCFEYFQVAFETKGWLKTGMEKSTTSEVAEKQKNQ